MECDNFTQGINMAGSGEPEWNLLELRRTYKFSFELANN
jgi:hypothetical protein